MQGKIVYIGVVKIDSDPYIFMSIPLIDSVTKGWLEDNGYQYKSSMPLENSVILAVWSRRGGFTEVEFLINQFKDWHFEVTIADQAMMPGNILNIKNLNVIL